MARYVIDAPTLLHLLDNDVAIHSGHQLVALAAVTRLQADALVTVDPDLAAKAAGIVPVVPLDMLSTDSR